MLKRIVEKMYEVIGAIAGVLFLSLFSLNIVRIALRYFADMAPRFFPPYFRLDGISRRQRPGGPA